MVMEYISDLKTVYPALEGRITFVDEDSSKDDCVGKVQDRNGSGKAHCLWSSAVMVTLAAGIRNLVYGYHVRV